MTNKELKKRFEKYIKLTEKALPQIKNPKGDALKLYEISKCYYDDALHFKEKGDIINAFAAINYAHAFLDAGALLGLFKVKNSKLFMVE